MNEQVTNVTYEGQNRVETITRTVTKADDADKLGALYYQLGALLRRLQTNSLNDAAKASVNEQITVIKASITEMAQYLAGYEVNQNAD